MYEQVFENLRRATDSVIQAQQELFRTWVGCWPAAPSFPPAWVDQTRTLQKKWADTVGDLVKKQRESLEAQFNAGLKLIEETGRVGTAQNPEELRVRLVECWQKSFDCIRQASEAQVQALQVVMARWADLAARPGG